MAEPVTTEPSPPKPAPVEQNAVNTESAAPASPAMAPKPATSSPAKEPTRLATNDQTPPQKPADMARTGEITEGAKKAEAVTRETIKEPTGETEKERKKLHVLPEGRQRYDSVEDSSESEPSPLQQRRRKISAASTSSEEYKLDSPGSGDEEDFIRKQIMEMSADEDASEDEDNYIRKQIKEEEEKREQDDKKVKCKSTSGKSKRLLKKSSVSHELEPERRHSWQESEEQECEESSDSKNRETKTQEGEAPSIDSGGGLRRFKTIELNNTTASPYNAGATVRQGTEEGELEMESLTDSPEDRSRGESSSLHASSFTPGTSPTSVSSFDEDSDSSPSHKRTSGEGKQHRKARHRQHGQVLPTIEDSSEEEEMREEEELLREQEKQREVDQQQVKKSSSKKSKKDKEELRAQRRREHPKTPPSNLSPIEDASPTEELRQAAEMEELHKSSCSEYSPSIESEPEGFEIHPDKIIAVQKVYKLPTSVSLYSPTEEQNTEMTNDMDKSLKSADEAYEEMMQNVKTLQATTMPGSYTDASLEAIAASLEALASPMVPGTDESTQQYQMEREFLELEKMKQLRLAEELEWERQEIQRFREQEQLIVQKELEELQTMKQQLLFQQEEERQAHLMMQQETYAQQQLQLEQIQQLQQQLQQQLEEQKMRQMFPYDPPTTSEQALLDAHYAGGEGSQYWPEQDQTGVPSNVAGLELQQNATWYTVPTEGVAQYISNLPESEIPLKESEGQELAIHTDRTPGQYDEHGTDALTRKIVESGVQTDEEEGADKACIGRRKRNKRSVDSSVQTDDEDQDEWDIPARSRRRSRSSKQGSKVSSIAIQTVAEISVQTDHSGTIKRPSVRAQVDTKLEIKQISSPEKTYRGGSTSCQTEVGSGKTSPQKDKRRPTPLEIGHSTHLKADSTLQVAPSPPKSPKVLYSPISPLSPSKSLEFVQYEKSVGDTIPQKMLTAESSKPPTSPRTLKAMQRSLSDPKPQSPTSEERTGSNFQYSDGYSGKGSQSSTPSGTQKKVKRTLPNPPPEEESAASQTGYSTGSARRRLCRNTTMARAKILQDIDRELDLVERESSKLRKKQAELDEEEKEIDAKLRYLEMGINRRKDALLKEREKRERAYLQGVAEERDYMSDSEVSNIRETRGNGHGLERPRTAPQSEFNQFIPPQTQPEAQYAQSGGSYTQYPYAPQTQATTQYPQQTLYQQPSLYHQQVSPYQSQSIYSSVPSLSYPQSSHQQSQQQSYQHTSQMLLMQQKARQTTLSDLEPKITTNYEVIRSQPLMMGSSSTDTSYAVPTLRASTAA
ncbi:hypothetical protein COCON_G00116160 [Conger conger]|uniref:Piccolo presynaptic cytomatrix protein n=1 Tax=Conger conger TaxID=82655 RepID=A0A9Q1DFV3_CONCO|nr:hypothetical protein COCON_G00116160 [Conger conger]